jgi:hypothetical protein
VSLGQFVVSRNVSLVGGKQYALHRLLLPPAPACQLYIITA